MLLDSGICKIWSERNVAAPGDAPNLALDLLTEAYYGRFDLGIKEAYINLQNNTDVNGKIRIWQDERVDNHCIVTLVDGRYYAVVRVYHGKDDDGLNITDITLGKRVAKYES